MKIVINSRKFPVDLGCRLLRTKFERYEDCNVKHAFLEEAWKDIKPFEFGEIAALKNLEERRMALSMYGIDKLIKKVKPTLISSRTIKKSNHYLDPTTEDVEESTIRDTYELYMVSGKILDTTSTASGSIESVYFVKCKCTSTGREYLIWVDMRAVANANGKGWWNWEKAIDTKNGLDAIHAIAWTFTTNVIEEAIQSIKRQGDCIMVKIKDSWRDKVYTGPVRHLRKEEYLEKLISES